MDGSDDAVTLCAYLRGNKCPAELQVAHLEGKPGLPPFKRAEGLLTLERLHGNSALEEFVHHGPWALGQRVAPVAANLMQAGVAEISQLSQLPSVPRG